MKKRLSNIEFLTQIMEYSDHGALMQAMVMEGVAKYAEIVAVSKPEDYPSTSMINPEAWISCAKELKEKLGEHYGIGVFKPVTEDKPKWTEPEHSYPQDWTPQRFADFKRNLAFAVTDRQESFVIEGNLYLVKYAKYLVEFLETLPQFKVK
jgi:hypothetical protein